MNNTRTQDTNIKPNTTGATEANPRLRARPQKQCDAAKTATAKTAAKDSNSAETPAQSKKNTASKPSKTTTEKRSPSNPRKRRGAGENSQAKQAAKRPAKKRKKAAEYRRIVHEFEPVFNEYSSVLVLGSFPSVLSRENNFYYGNPQNRFWRVLAHWAKAPVPATIEEKKSLLLDQGVALWDVIEECDIKGSSDASIKNVVPAHVERILAAAPVRAIICNGSTAGRLYKKYLQYKTGIEAVTLPSTSPANAAWNIERLRETWTEGLTRATEASTRQTAAEASTPKTMPETASPSETEYALVSLAANRAPEASSYAVHRSMKGNKRANTKPELLVRERLRAAGLTGYRLQWKVPGRPDIAWPGKKVALFVNGCFWHRCPHCNPSTPKRNVEYWTAKFQRNMERDAQSLEALRAEGWKTHIIWECQLKKKTIDATMEALLPELAHDLGKELHQDL